MSTIETKTLYLFIKRHSLWILLIALVALRVSLSRPVYEKGQKIRISARVLSEPIRYETSQSLHLAGLKVYLDPLPEVNYGDNVVVEGEVGEGKLLNAKLIKVKEAKSPLFVVRNKLLRFYQSSLPEPHSSLVAGITLGSKASLPESFYQALKGTGTLHVVVASGMNVTLTANFLISSTVHFLSRKKAIILSIIGIWIYTFLSGFDAPLVRAAIMGSIAFSAQALGRLSSAVRALVLSAIIMLVINPSWYTDLGFIMSFLATLGLILFQKPIAKRLFVIPSILREDLATTIAAQIAVSPILIFVFGQLNLFSPLINALVLWTIAPIMIISSVGAVAGLFVPSLGKLILLLVYPLTFWFIKIIETFA